MEANILLKLLQVSERGVEVGRAKPAKQLFQELRKELKQKKE